MPNIRTRYKVYSADGEHAASVVDPADAAHLCVWLGAGTLVFYTTQSRRVRVWTEGAERFSADGQEAIAGDLMADRVALWRAERRPLSAQALTQKERTNRNMKALGAALSRLP